MEDNYRGTGPSAQAKAQGCPQHRPLGVAGVSGIGWLAGLGYQAPTSWVCAWQGPDLPALLSMLSSGNIKSTPQGVAETCHTQPLAQAWHKINTRHVPATVIFIFVPLDRGLSHF